MTQAVAPTPEPMQLRLRVGEMIGGNGSWSRAHGYRREPKSITTKDTKLREGIAAQTRRVRSLSFDIIRGSAG